MFVGIYSNKSFRGSAGINKVEQERSSSLAKFLQQIVIIFFFLTFRYSKSKWKSLSPDHKNNVSYVSILVSISIVISISKLHFLILPKNFPSSSAGDILMSCSGTIGKFVIVPEKFKKGIINQALLKITPIQKITSEFLRLTLENYFSSNNTHVKGMAIKNIAAVKELKKIKIPLPPVAEQKKIVKHLDDLSEKLRKLQEYQRDTKSDMESLERSVLHRAFVSK